MCACFQGARITKHDIDRVFALYDRVGGFHIASSNKDCYRIIYRYVYVQTDFYYMKAL